jgi:hypothetical protein
MRISTGHGGFGVETRRGSRPIAGVGLARSTADVGLDPLLAWVWQWFSSALVVGLPGQIHGRRGSRPTAGSGNGSPML